MNYVDGSWTESTINASLLPAMGTTIASGVSVTKSNAHDYIVIDITPAVAAWLDGTQANDGIALVANSPLSCSFTSKESTTYSHSPELDIVFLGNGAQGQLDHKALKVRKARRDLPVQWAPSVRKASLARRESTIAEPGFRPPPIRSTTPWPTQVRPGLRLR